MSAETPDKPHRRRPRYSGTHPRRFEERYKELDPHAHPEMQEHVLAQGRTPAGTHVPVLLEETMAALAPRRGEVALDCTVGFGGHAAELLLRTAPDGRLIGLDVDAAQLERTRQRLAEFGGRVALHRRHFGGIGDVLRQVGLDGCDIILADLGVSSMQIDDPARGFSYKQDGPLDMRMDDRLRLTAADVLAQATEGELAGALRNYADERDAERIAAAIIRERARRPIRTSRELVRVVLAAKGMTQQEWKEQARAGRAPSRGGPGGAMGGRAPLHPAARTFQALRILVNDELNGLRQLLRAAPYCLRAGGRLAVISFHSGEHRLVEAALLEGVTAGLYQHVMTEPVRPGPAERRANPRSSSAQLRWAVR